MFQYYCYKCEHEWDSIIHVDVCPVCGSDNLTPLREWKTKIDEWHPGIMMGLIKIFRDTPFTFDHCKNNIIEYGAGYGKSLVRKIVIDFEKREVSYIRQPVLTREKRKIMKFEKITDITVPKTFEEFDEIVGCG